MLHVRYIYLLTLKGRCILDLTYKGIVSYQCSKIEQPFIWDGEVDKTCACVVPAKKVMSKLKRLS